MADKTVDEILIEIEAPAQHAKDGLEAVKRSLTSIKNASNGIDVKGLEKIKNFLNGLKLSGDTGASMESTGKGIRSIATSIKTLSTIDSSKLKEVTDSVSMVGQSLGNLGTNNKISIKIDSEGIKKAVQPLEQVKEATADMASSLQAESNEVQSAAGNLTNLASLEEKISDSSVKAAESSKELDMSLAKIAQDSSPAALKNLDMTLANFSAKDAKSELQQLIDKINEYKRTIAGMESGKIAVDSDAYTDAVRGLSQATEELKKFKSEFNGIGDAKALDGIRKKVDSAFGTIGKVATETKNALSGIVNVAKSAIKGVGNLFSKMNTHLKKTTSTFEGLRKKFHTFTRLYTFMALRKMLTKVFKDIGEAFNLLAQYSDNMGTKFNKNVSLLAADAKWLGRSIIAAFEPILNAVAPILDMLVAKIVSVINAVNQLLSAITGLSTFTRAKKSVENYAAGLDKAGKAAKELKKTVLGFDELNQLQDNKDSSGGGSSSVNPNDVFETADIDDKFKKWADWLKSMWAKGDFSELGKSIGNWILNALNSIPWTKIKAKAYKLGKSFATLLNGIFETPELGRTIGKTIAETINTAVLLANGFVRNFHWDSFGKFIGDTFNGFFENIDWYYIKDTFVTGMRGLAISIQNFIDTFHWDNISTTVINALETAAAGIRAFFENIDWKDLGTKFGTQLKKIITDTDWKEVGKAIGDVIQAAIDFVSNTLEQLSWGDVIEALTNLFSGFFSKVNVAKIYMAIQKLLLAAFLWACGKVALKGATIALTEAVKQMVVKAIGAKAVGTAASTTMGEVVTEAATGSAATGAATTAGTSLGTTIAAAVVAAFVGQQVGTEIGKAIWPEDAELYDQYKGISGFFKEIKDTATSTADWIKMAFSGDLANSRLWESMSREEQNYYSALKVHYGEEFPAFMQQNVREFGSLEEAWKHVKDEAKGYYDETQEKLAKQREGMDQVKETMNHIYDTKAAEGFKTMQEHTESLKNSLDHIADSKAREAFAEMHNLTSDAAGAFEELTITVERDTGKIDSSLGICDTKAAEAFKNMTNGATQLDTNTKQSLTSVGTSLNNNKIEIQSYENQWAASNLEISGQVHEMSANTSSSMNEIKVSVADSMADVNKSLNTVKDGMSEDKWTFSGVWEGLGKTFENAKNAIKGIWNDIANTLNGDHEIGGGKWSIHLPTFANGGTVPEDGLFMANHTELVGRFSNGRTAVANNEMITDGIADAVYDAVSAAGGLGGGDVPVNTTIMIDGMVLARATTKGQRSLDRRYSPTMA